MNNDLNNVSRGLLASLAAAGLSATYLAEKERDYRGLDLASAMLCIRNLDADNRVTFCKIMKIDPSDLSVFLRVLRSLMN